MSGSLWYDGFLDFMEQSRPARLPEKVYFSLGDRESKIKNRRFAAVEECTIKAYNLIQSLGTNTLFEWNTGNHYVNVPERIAKGLKWISV
jgi:predicted alpha/beta superfamily hydrolase